MNLSNKQIAFCNEYLNDLNASKAAIRAGYSVVSSRSTGTELMNNPSIKAHIRKLLDQRNNDTFINAGFIIGNLISIVNQALEGDPIMAWDAKKNCLKDTGRKRPDRHAAIKALAMLGKHIGLFDKEYVAAWKTMQQPQMTREQFDELLEEMRASQREHDAQMSARGNGQQQKMLNGSTA